MGWLPCNRTLGWLCVGLETGRPWLSLFGCRVFILCSVWCGAGNGSVRACGLSPHPLPPAAFHVKMILIFLISLLMGKQFIGESPAVWVWVWVDATTVCQSAPRFFPKRANTIHTMGCNGTHFIFRPLPPLHLPFPLPFIFIFPFYFPI